jgi:predicted RNase H-like HicB family nuclease
MKLRATYWKESDGKYLGHLNDHPEHWTQGENLDDLKDHLQDLYVEFSREDLPGIKKVMDIEVG